MYRSSGVWFLGSMSTEVKLQRQGNRVRITLELTLQPQTPMLEYEQQIQDALNQAGVLATRECLRAFDTDGSPITVDGVKLTSKGPVTKDYQTPYGTAPLERHVYQSSQGGRTFCPLDQGARVVQGATPRFARQCSFKYAVLNSVLAQEDLSQNHGREVSRCYLQDVSAAVAALAQAKEECWRYAEPELPAAVASVGLGMDGTCMLYCQEGWRQAMVGTIALYDEQGERLHTLYLAKPPEYGKDQFYEEMGRELLRYAQRYGQARWVGVADGAHDQWPWLECWTDQSIVDFWHAASYLEKAAPAMAARKAERTQWFEDNRHRLKEEEGAAADLLREMKQALAQRQPRGAARQGLEEAITYFKNHLPRMDYAQYRKQHLPIGSGITEAACKTVVKQRLCGSGMKWKESGTATVLRLRCLILTQGRWEQFWAKVSRFGT